MPVSVFVTAYEAHAIRASGERDGLPAQAGGTTSASRARWSGGPRRKDRADVARGERLESPPARPARTTAAVLRRRREPSPARPPPTTPGADRGEGAGRIFLLDPDDIDWIEAEGDYVACTAARGVPDPRRDLVDRGAARGYEPGADPSLPIVNVGRVQELRHARTRTPVILATAPPSAQPHLPPSFERACGYRPNAEGGRGADGPAARPRFATARPAAGRPRTMLARPPRPPELRRETRFSLNRRSRCAESLPSFSSPQPSPGGRRTQPPFGRARWSARLD